MSHYRSLALALVCWLSTGVQAQELFVYSEPASNMPAKSIGFRANNWLMDETNTGKLNYHFIPEIMWGANRHLMIHVEGFISNRNGSLTAEGLGLYAKYRLFSIDQVYKHTRIAAFGRATTNNADIHQEMIMGNGHNTGYQAGFITTQLLHKTALSLTAYYEQATDNQAGNEFPVAYANKALNYSLSAGRLILPRSYKGYKQTNLNIMLELIGQVLPENQKQFIDIAPSVQLIFNSQTRVDIGYRQELYSNMLRTAPNGLLVRIEHVLFNVT